MTAEYSLILGLVALAAVTATSYVGAVQNVNLQEVGFHLETANRVASARNGKRANRILTNRAKRAKAKFKRLRRKAAKLRK